MEGGGEPTFKVVMLGETMTGKTTILERLKCGAFVEVIDPTVGVQFYSHRFVIGGHPVRLDLWDTAGQERYKAMSTMYYRGTPSAVVVYDISRRDTFSGAKRWVREVLAEGAMDCTIALCGNKLDREAVREVMTEDASEFATVNGIAMSVEISAKTGQGLNEMFEMLAGLLLVQHNNAAREAEESLTDFEGGRSHKCC